MMWQDLRNFRSSRFLRPPEIEWNFTEISSSLWIWSLPEKLACNYLLYPLYVEDSRHFLKLQFLSNLWVKFEGEFLCLNFEEIVIGQQINYSELTLSDSSSTFHRNFHIFEIIFTENFGFFQKTTFLNSFYILSLSFRIFGRNGDGIPKIFFVKILKTSWFIKHKWWN